MSLAVGNLLIAVRDHVIPDPLIDLAVHHSQLHQVQLGAIGPEANNAARPTARHAGDLQQFIDAGVVDVHALFGGRGRRRCFGSSARIPIVVLRPTGQAHAQDCNRCRRRSRPFSHHLIFLPSPPRPQALGNNTPCSISIDVEVMAGCALSPFAFYSPKAHFPAPCMCASWSQDGVFRTPQTPSTCNN